MNFLKVLAVALLIPMLAACGTTRGDRIASGAAIGAGVGAGAGMLAGGAGTTGALIGAAAGGAVGGLTDSSHINLGKPVWK